MKVSKPRIFQFSASLIKKVIKKKSVKKLRKARANAAFTFTKPRTEQETAELRRNLSVLSGSDIEHLEQHKRSALPKIFGRIQKFITADLATEQKKIFSRQVMYLTVIIIIAVITTISTETYFIVKKLQPKPHSYNELQTVLSFVSTKKVLYKLIPNIGQKKSIWYTLKSKLLSTNFIYKSAKNDIVGMLYSVTSDNYAISPIAQQLKIINTIVNVEKSKKGSTNKYKITLRTPGVLYWSYWVIPTANLHCLSVLAYNPGIGFSTYAVSINFAYSWLDFNPTSYPNGKFPNNEKDLAKIIKTEKTENFYTESISSNKSESIHQMNNKDILLSSTTSENATKTYSFVFDLQIIGAGSPIKSFIKTEVTDQLSHHIDFSFGDFLKNYNFTDISKLLIKEEVSILSVPITSDNTSWLDGTNFKCETKKKPNNYF